MKRPVYEPLTEEEARQPEFFCERCETTQKRRQLHHCVATEKWKAMKAALHAKNPLPPPRVSAPEPARQPKLEGNNEGFEEDVDLP